MDGRRSVRSAAAAVLRKSGFAAAPPGSGAPGLVAGAAAAPRPARTVVEGLALALAMCLSLALPAAAAFAATHMIALFPAASNSHWEGFARVINHSDDAGIVRITGIDDEGAEYGPVELALEARATAHVNSGDLERGNPGKELSGELGAGAGDWRLRLESALAIEVLSYIRTGDGFVTTMRDVVPVQGRYHHVRFFNPASNTSQVSRLRLMNPGDEEVEVTIEGRDDDGEPAPGGEVHLVLAPGGARDVSARALEEGGDDLVGSLGDGKGKWQLLVSADAAIGVMSLLESPTGHLSNLSAPGRRDFSEGRREVGLPLFLPASDAERKGFARLLNHSEASGTVRIHGIDDEGGWSGPVVMTLEPGVAVHFNSEDLERGNPDKGLAGALGAGPGSWRLRLYSELDIEAFAYVRTGDGFVTTMHERVRESAMRHHVGFFNPGSNASQVSRLRLVNPGEEEVEVTITGRDDDGEPAPGGAVTLTLGPGRAREVVARELESGGDGLAGRLGDGSGKWQLFVTADGAIEVMSLLRSPTGHLANLSAAGVGGIVSEEGLDSPVALNVMVDLPREVTTVRASDIETTTLGSGRAGVSPGGTPALMVASDPDGAVLFALVDEDGGFLGETPGAARVSVASTAVVLAALAAGHRIASVTPETVAAILSHPEFGALTRALVRLLDADKNALIRLSRYPDVLASIQGLAGSLPVGGGAARARPGKRAARVARAALPEGIVREGFYCTALTRRPCSPWHAEEPWRWFGEARGAEAYYPGGTDWLRLLQSAAPFAEGYRDFLEEAAQPPFLARSERAGRRAVHAAANPGFAGHAMELHEGSRLAGWHHVPGNTTTVSKLLSSGAAYRGVVAGDGGTFGPEVDRVRFERYRLGADGGGNSRPEHAAVVSFLNTARFMTSVAHQVTDMHAVEAWLQALSGNPRRYPDVARCAAAYAGRLVETDDPSLTVAGRMLAYFRTNAGAFFGTLPSDPECRALVRETGGEGLERMLRNLVAPAALAALRDAVHVAAPAFDGPNDTVPGAVSYFAPSAARSEYRVAWERTPDGEPYVARVARHPLPVADFTYEQQGGFEVRLDASASEGEGLGYEWTVEGARIGSGRTLVHDFGGAGAFRVALAVVDRHGASAEARGRVTVTAGRVPEISRLTCAESGSGKAFTMEAVFSDPDDDIDVVEWFSSITNRNPDRRSQGGLDRVTLGAPRGASSTRAKVRVTDVQGNAAERTCEVVFDRARPVALTSDVRAEEGEALTFTVDLYRLGDEALTLYYATYGASARDEDYEAHSPTALHFARGERTRTITVQTREDGRVERDETFYVYLVESTDALGSDGYPVGYLARAAGTIADDDETPEPVLVPRIADAEAEEGEGLEFTVTLDRAPDDAVTFYYATYGASAQEDDYDAHPATALRFAPGERTKTLTVQTSEDDEDETDETFHVYVTKSRGDLAGSTPARYLARATGTIRDDDGEDTGLQTCSGPTVRIPDAALRRKVEQALDKTPGAPITPDEMVGLERLWAPGGGGEDSIVDLRGLECATRLEFLGLSGHRISDLSPLSTLASLRRLELGGNHISDLSPLAGLTALQLLYLSQNRELDLSTLSGLPALEQLYLASSEISDVSGLSGLPALEYLNLRRNRISDASPLSGLPALEELVLTENRELEVSTLAELTVKDLDLTHCEISDLSTLTGLTALVELDLSYNQISDMSPLTGLTSLVNLYLTDNQISDVPPLSGLTALKNLRLPGNHILEVTLSGPPGLESLSLVDNRISKVSLSGLPALQYINLKYNRISEMSLSGLTALVNLILVSSEVSDLSPLSELPALRNLYLHGNQVSDLSPLSGLTSLSELGLSMNRISDIEPLVSNPGLGRGDHVWLSGNPLSTESLNVHVPALWERGVVVLLQ